MMSLGSVTMRLHILSSCMLVLIRQRKKLINVLAQYRQLVMEMANLEKGQSMFCHLKLLFI